MGLIFGILFAVVGAIGLLKKHRLLGAGFIIIALVLQGFVIADTKVHWGTTVTTEVTKQKIEPVANIKGNQLMILKKITRGQTHETAYVYKDKNGNRESFLDKHHAVRVVQTNQRQAYKRRQQQQYHYRNQFLRWLFYGGTNEGEVKHQTITFMVNQDWTEVTPSQITKVKHQLRSAEERQKMKRAVTSQFRNRLKAHPELAKSQSEQTRLQATITKEYLKKLIRKA